MKKILRWIGADETDVRGAFVLVVQVVVLLWFGMLVFSLPIIAARLFWSWWTGS